MTNSCCKADNDKQITLYKWRYTIQQKQNNFNTNLICGMNIMINVMLLYWTAQNVLKLPPMIS